VNALDGALRRALVNFFPKLKRVKLIDYKVRILDAYKELTRDISAIRKDLGQSGEKVIANKFTDVQTTVAGQKLAGTAAKTRVLITSSDGKREWGTVGVSENIIEASLQALVDSLEYALLKR
jgi:2-isopropylmalate synthase